MAETFKAVNQHHVHMGGVTILKGSFGPAQPAAGPRPEFQGPELVERVPEVLGQMAFEGPRKRLMNPQMEPGRRRPGGFAVQVSGDPALEISPESPAENEAVGFEAAESTEGWGRVKERVHLERSETGVHRLSHLGLHIGEASGAKGSG